MIGENIYQKLQFIDVINKMKRKRLNPQKEKRKPELLKMHFLLMNIIILKMNQMNKMTKLKELKKKL